MKSRRRPSTSLDLEVTAASLSPSRSIAGLVGALRRRRAWRLRRGDRILPNVPSRAAGCGDQHRKEREGDDCFMRHPAQSDNRSANDGAKREVLERW